MVLSTKEQIKEDQKPINTRTSGYKEENRKNHELYDKS